MHIRKWKLFSEQKCLCDSSGNVYVTVVGMFMWQKWKCLCDSSGNVYVTVVEMLMWQ